MALTLNERAARHRAKMRGESIPVLKRGPQKGYKQSPDHIKKRIRRGPEHHSWVGNKITKESGRSRAERKYPVRPCEICGESKKRIDRHHRDNDPRNNKKSNIKFLCRKCHMIEDGRLERFVELAKRNQSMAAAARHKQTIL